MPSITIPWEGQPPDYITEMSFYVIHNTASKLVKLSKFIDSNRYKDLTTERLLIACFQTMLGIFEDGRYYELEVAKSIAKDTDGTSEHMRIFQETLNSINSARKGKEKMDKSKHDLRGAMRQHDNLNGHKQDQRHTGHGGKGHDAAQAARRHGNGHQQANAPKKFADAGKGHAQR